MSDNPLTIVVFLPWPPSVNRIWRSGKGRVYRDPKYLAWQKEAGWAIKQRVFGRSEGLKGKFDAEITLMPPNARPYDPDNRIKVILDLAQKHDLIENDSLLNQLVVRRCPLGPKSGALLTLLSVA
jgi:crossover junction endodeoxyribonuclease RusA